MRYKLVGKTIQEEPSPQELKPMKEGDPSLRMGYFYNRQQFLLLQCLADYNDPGSYT